VTCTVDQCAVLHFNVATAHTFRTDLQARHDRPAGDGEPAAQHRRDVLRLVRKLEPGPGKNPKNRTNELHV